MQLRLAGKAKTVFRVLKGMVRAEDTPEVARLALTMEDAASEMTHLGEAALNFAIDEETRRIVAFRPPLLSALSDEVKWERYAEGLANHLIRNKAQVEMLKRG